MENIHNMKTCPWITEEPVKLRDYFEQYQKTLDNIQDQPYQQKIDRDEAIQDFFHLPGHNEVPADENQFDLKRLEDDCSVDLLNVEDELAPHDVLNEPIKHSGRLTNWYAGSFQDGIIPPAGSEVLATLQSQEHELHLRETVRDFARLRNRHLKYFSTIRMVIDKDNSPEPTSFDQDNCCASQRDIMLNVRVQRPYHKKTHMKKACNRFPTHSQEMLLLGSQKLTKLRDSIICINDLAVNQDLSADPQLFHLSHLPNNAREFPSGFLYINGVIYDDTRNPDSKRYSEGIMKWAKKNSDIGKIEACKMEDTTFLDLELRLGYPYLYMHQGNCEHIIVFTDVRLHHQDDVQDLSRYPLFRGQASKLSIKCCICALCLANWIVKDDPRIMVPYMHVCDGCLKLFFYTFCGVKIHNIKVFPFIDEFMPQQKKYIDTGNT